jgi:hypothetical protein
MKRPLRTLAIGTLVLLVAGCANPVAGTAEVDSAAAAAVSSARLSSPDPSVPQSIPQQSLPPESSAPGSSAPESSAPDSGAPASSAEESPPASSAPAPSAPDLPAPSTSSAPSTPTSVSRPTKLSCPAGALFPSARTFCYQIPSGFLDGSKTATYPGTDPVKSAIQIKGTGRTRDLIFVTSTVLGVNADKLDAAVIKVSLTRAFNSTTSAASTTAIAQSTVAGDRAFETTIKFTDGVQQRYLIIFAGFTRVSVSCQWQDHAATIAAGCTSVLGSLQIKNP